jgi:cytochrome c biogenesis protein
MRTALILLFALALAAIPGSLVPQRRISPVRVSDFINEHPRLGPIYDRVGLFSVYTSPWFSAIYLLSSSPSWGASSPALACTRGRCEPGRPRRHAT